MSRPIYCLIERCLFSFPRSTQSFIIRAKEKGRESAKFPRSALRKYIEPKEFESPSRAILHRKKHFSSLKQLFHHRSIKLFATLPVDSDFRSLNCKCHAVSFNSDVVYFNPRHSSVVAKTIPWKIYRTRLGRINTYLFHCHCVGKVKRDHSHFFSQKEMTDAQMFSGIYKALKIFKTILLL